MSVSIPVSDPPPVVRRRRRGDADELIPIRTDRRELLLRIVACQLGRPLGSCRAEVEDIVQDSLLEAYADLETAAPTTEGGFRRWLVTLTLNNMRDHRRRARVRERVGPLRTTILEVQRDRQQRQPASIANDGEAWLRTERALLLLQPEDREVLSMRAFQAMSSAEIAAALGLGTPEAARTRIARARARLQQRLADHG